MEFETWFTRIALSITFIVVSLLTKREYSKSRCELQEENTGTGNDYSKWLHRFTISTMILCGLLPLFGVFNKIPIICGYTYSVPTLLWGLAPTSLTFYQITRLQYVFSKTQVHSNFGYSKCVFIILYIYGIFVIMLSIISVWFSQTFVSNGEYGCSVNSTNLATKLLGIYAICYIIWDFTVLLMYLLKFCQSRKRWMNNKNGTVWQRINFILTKILILTLFYEFKYMSTIVVIQFTSSTIVNTILMMTDSIIISLSIYLMREHNNNEYKRLVKIYNTICCNWDKYELPMTPTQLESRTSSIRSKSVSPEKKVDDPEIITKIPTSSMNADSAGHTSVSNRDSRNSYGEFTITVKMQHTNPYIDEESMSKDIEVIQ